METTVWRPLTAFSQTEASCQSKNRIALVLMTTPINEQNKSFFKQLWSKAGVKLCADGASNVLYDWSASNHVLETYIPDYIIGDLDSIRPEVRNYYDTVGTKVVQIHDQNSTDFTKTLRFTLGILQSSTLSNSIDQICCFATFSGRADHAFANLHTLCIAESKERRVYVITEESTTFLLSQGRNLIYLNDEPSALGKYCGFFPLLGPTKVTTNGFKWNLIKTTCTFDGQVSSSNEFDLGDDDFVTIETEKPLLFTMTIKPIS
jgi:thiamine pyrophosphokinase